MKKMISYIMIICVLVSLGGCVWDPAITYFDYDELKEQLPQSNLSITKMKILKSSKTPVMCCLLISLKWR